MVRAGSGHFFHGAGRVLGLWFCTGRARVTVNLDGLISGQNISNSGHFRAAFGPLLYMNNGNKTQKVPF